MVFGIFSLKDFWRFGGDGRFWGVFWTPVRPKLGLIKRFRGFRGPKNPGKVVFRIFNPKILNFKNRLIRPKTVEKPVRKVKFNLKKNEIFDLNEFETGQNGVSRRFWGL